jgi:nitrate/nitrite-specific signal transduction histidine kinase
VLFQLGRPIALLTRAAEAVEAGRFEPPLLQSYAERQDEIGRLTQSLVDMAAAIEAREADLRRQVEDLGEKET